MALKTISGVQCLAPNQVKYLDTVADTGLTALMTEQSGDYLFSIQGEDGCWDSNTALILYAISPKPSSISGDSNTPSISNLCENFGNYCVPAGECSLNNSLDNFYCRASNEICCKVKPIQESCSQKRGIICPSGQVCSETEVIAEDTMKCCLGSCQLLDTTTQCEKQGYSCYDSCNPKYQEEKSAYSSSCRSGQVCCEDKIVSDKGNWWWIIILIILIILVVLAIIFRDKLKLWYFKLKTTKFGPGPKPTSRPNIPPRQIPPNPGIRKPVPNLRPSPLYRSPIKKPEVPIRNNDKDKEFEETISSLEDFWLTKNKFYTFKDINEDLIG